jgi:hypothetical protein
MSSLRRCYHRRVVTISSRGDPPLLLPPTRDDAATAIVSAAARQPAVVAAATALTLPSLPSPAALRPSVAATADAWQRCRCYRVLCRGSAATLPSLLSPPRYGNQPSLQPSLSSPVAWRYFVAAIADVWRQCRCCGVLWRSNPQLLVPPTRGDAATAAISAAVRKSTVVTAVNTAISCGVVALRCCYRRGAATGDPPSLC